MVGAKGWDFVTVCLHVFLCVWVHETPFPRSPLPAPPTFFPV